MEWQKYLFEKKNKKKNFFALMLPQLVLLPSLGHTENGGLVSIGTFSGDRQTSDFII